MNTISQQDLWRYLEGEIEDEHELVRIEAAIADDPELARQCEELEAELEPSPEALEFVRGQFRALDASIWARMVPDSPQAARLELPGTQVIQVSVRASPDSLRLGFRPRPQGWIARCIAVMHARAPLSITVDNQAQVAPAERVAADGGGSRAAEPALFLAMDHDDSVWISEVAQDSTGGAAWLEDSDEGLTLMVNLPESAKPLEQVRYRLQWHHPQNRQLAEKTGTAPLISNAGRRFARMPLGMPAADVRRSPRWSLRVESILGEEAPYLDATDFREQQSADLQVLILNEIAEASDPKQLKFQAAFHSDRQREMWNDHAAACWVRFEAN